MQALLELTRKYRFYKRGLYFYFVLNVFFICVGFAALCIYIQNHDLSALTLVGVGTGTAIFGILLPLFVFYKMANLLKSLRQETEKMAARWVAGWASEYAQSENGIQNPQFWLNLVLLSVEILGEGATHPVLRTFAELAPTFRAELKKASSNGPAKPKRGSRRKSAKPKDSNQEVA